MATLYRGFTLPNPLPYYPMYTEDFNGSERVKLQSLAANGLYLLCLNHAWKYHGLPLTIERIIAVLGLGRMKARDARRVWPEIAECFEEREDRLVNIRQEEVRNSAIISSSSHADAARKRWEAKRNADANALPRASDSDSLSVSDSSEETATTEEIASRVSDVRADNGFVKSLNGGLDGWVDRIYRQHPKKKHKTLVGAQLVRLLERGEDLREVAFIHSLWCRTPNWTKENGSFCPILAEWLADEGYEQIPDGFDHQFDEFRRNNAVQKQGTKH